MSAAFNIGSAVRAERKAKGKTLSEIATALGITLSKVWQLEKLNRGSMRGLERICQFLGLEWVGLAPGRSLGSRIRAERLKQGWTQEALSKRTGVSRPALRRVETDRAQLSTLFVVLDIIAPDIRLRNGNGSLLPKVLNSLANKSRS
jgi:transcriptional regulator with XRE-family HTH domain